jgi:putative ABC transport system ATP-binding protein
MSVTDSTLEPTGATPGTSAAAIYELRAVKKIYGSGAASVAALSDVSLRIEQGEFVVVEGPSGSGKTTLLQLFGALDKPTSGEVHFEGRDLQTLGEDEQARFRRDAVGFVFQQFNLIPTLSARQNVEIAMVPTDATPHDRSRRAKELLEKVGLGGRIEHLPTQLSGGEQQRVAIARSLANNARVLLADEPTGNLDSQTGVEVLNLLGKLRDEDGLTIVLITHDLSVADRASRVVKMRDGAVAEDSGAKGPIVL